MSHSLSTTTTVLLACSHPIKQEEISHSLAEMHLVPLLCDKATSAMQALEDKEIAIVLSDETLSDADGVELLGKIHEKYPETVGILCGKGDDPKKLKKALSDGRMFAFIEEPIDKELFCRAIGAAKNRWDETEQKRNVTGLLSKQHHRLSQTYQMVEEEMRLGARIHDTLLRGDVPKDTTGVHIATFSSANRDVDGDFFDFYRPSATCQDLVFADVMGKGLPAALVGTAMKAQLTRYASASSQTSTCHDTGVWEPNLLSIGAIMHSVQEQMAQSLIELGYFVSMFYSRLDLERKIFSYIDCGAPKPLLLQKDSDQVVELAGENFPFGMIADDRYMIEQVNVEKGDLLLFFSDGITEAKSLHSELFGTEKIKELLLQHRALSPEKIIEKILDAVHEFMGSTKYDDDVTLICMQCTMEMPEGPDEQAVMRFASSLEQLPELRQFIAQQCVKIPGNRKLMSSQLQLAINEAFCNIVKHGYKDCCGEIVLTIRRKEKGLELELADQTQGFDPSTVAPPNLTGQQEGGYGVHIVKTLSDQLSYSRSCIKDGWNRLTIYKNYEMGMKEMNLQHTEQQGVLTVNLDMANLDASQAPAFKKKMIALVDQENCSRVVLDIGTLQFIDSSGLGSLLSILRHLNSLQGDLKLAHMTEPVRAMFEIVRMHKLFEIFASTEEAIDSFQH